MERPTKLSIYVIPFLMTLVAGLATSVGGLLGVFGKPVEGLAERRASNKFLSFGLGFSAGAMIYISLVDILPKGIEHLSINHSKADAHWLGIFGFFGGIALIAVIDKLIPKDLNPHEPIVDSSHNKTLMRTGIFTAAVLTLHNFPEGLVTFVAALDDPKLALGIVFAIAIHNIPEGLVVAIPIYHGTGIRKKALTWATLSGLAEPLGAVLGYALIFPFMGETTFGVLFSAIAGIMLFVCVDELLPAAKSFGDHHLATYGVILGCLIMAVSIALFF